MARALNRLRVDTGYSIRSCVRTMMMMMNRGRVSTLNIIGLKVRSVIRLVQSCVSRDVDRVG